MTATSVRPADSKFAILGPRRGELVRAHHALQARAGQVKVDLDTTPLGAAQVLRLVYTLIHTNEEKH